MWHALKLCAALALWFGSLVLACYAALGVGGADF